MKVLIIGGSGYIGSYTAWYLQRKHFDVTIYDLEKPVVDCKWIEGDIRDIKGLKESDPGWAAVVIMSGAIGDKVCEEDPVGADILNHMAIADICNAFEDRHIIFMSTCAVYGANPERLTENSPTSPISVYAKTKLAGETHVMSVEGTIFRLGSVFGVGMENKMRLDSIVNVLVRRAVLDHEITILGGNQWKALISVRDIAGFIEEALTREIRGVYNISSRNYTLREIGEWVCKYIPGTVIEYGPRPENDRDYKVNSVKRLTNFKYDAKYGIAEEILRLAEYFSNELYK